MANTENIEAKLAAYVDGELDPTGRAEIEQYLKTNPQHRELIEELRSAKSYLQDLPRASAPPEVAEMISQQLERAALLGDVEIGADSGAGHFSRWPQVRAIAAILILTVGLAGVLYYVLPSPKPMSPEQVAIVTPDLPRANEPTEALEKARPSQPGLADADSRDSTARGSVGVAGAAAGGGGANSVAMAPAPAQNAELREQLAAAPSAQLCILVNTSDPARADNEVINYFASNQISYEHIASSDAIAMGVKRESDVVSPASTPTTAPLMDNNVATMKDAAGATTNPTDDKQNETAASFGRKMQSWPTHFKAKMTRGQAANLSETLSQSKTPQVAQVVSPEALQQNKQLEQQQGQFARNEPVPSQQSQAATSPTTDTTSADREAVAATPTPAPVPAPVIADRAIGGVKADILAPHDMLAPGDTIRVRVANQFLPDMPIADETPTIDEAGYVEIPRLGRVKASGLTSAQLTASILPQQAQRNRESQAPRADLVWSIEKVRPEPTTAPTHARSATSAPATQDVAAGDRKQLQQSASTQTVAGATTNPTTSPSESSTPQAGALAEDEKLDVVVIVQAASGSSAAPNPSDNNSAIIGPADKPVEPTTLPTTQPTTAPSR